MNRQVDYRLVKTIQHLDLSGITDQILSDLILAKLKQESMQATELVDLSCPDRGLKAHLRALQSVQDLV